MYLKDPNKKVSYSFRINPQLLEDLKLYAKAKDEKLPNVLNEILEDYIFNFNLKNDYLEHYGGMLINIPFGEHYLSEGYDGNLKISFDNGISDYLDFEEEGLNYEVNKIPNNLDVWNDVGGYTSRLYKEGIIHEGISLLIVPNLVLYPKLDFNYLTTDVIMNCLKYIYFVVNKDKTISVVGISYKECFRRLKQAGNNELLYKLKSIDNLFYKFSIDFVREYGKSKDSVDLDSMDNFRMALYKELVKFAKEYNDGNIVNLDENEINIDIAGDTNDSALKLENDILKDRIRELEDKQEELEIKLESIMDKD